MNIRPEATFSKSSSITLDPVWVTPAVLQKLGAMESDFRDFAADAAEEHSDGLGVALGKPD